MKTLINRLLSPTPGWFKKIINLALTLAAAGGSIQAAVKLGYHVPDNIVALANNLIIIGLVAAGISKTAKEDQPNAVEPPPTAGPGTSSLPLFILAVLCSLLLTGCARKVALQKSSEHSITDSTGTTVDTSRQVAINSHLITNYYGDTITGNMFLQADTAATAPVAFDTITTGGITLRLGLKKAGNGYKAIYTVVAKPVTTTEASTMQQASDQGKTTTVDLHKALDASSKVKTVTAPSFTPSKLVLIGVVLFALVLVFAFFKPYFQTAFGGFIALFKHKENKV